MTGQVSLPMYDLPGLEPLWDKWWRRMAVAMATDGVAGLDSGLTRVSDLMANWRGPDMALSQTCGYPFVFGVGKDWRLLATPVYAVDWCDGPRYRNLVLVRRDDPAAALADLRGRVVGYNSEDSHSGYNSIRSMIAPLAEKGQFFGKSIQTGGHLAGIRALTAGAIDCCSVDCVTFALIAKHGIAPVDGIRVLAEGPLVPGLPFIVPRSTPDASVTQMRDSLTKAIAHPELSDLNDALLISGFEVVSEAAYGAIRSLDADARAKGYPQLA